MSGHDRQRGYTFVEILTVITILGILVALLLPAVQAAREAARRTSCSKNLDQLIVGIHNYEMLHRVYPTGTINDTGPIHALPQGYHHNWVIQLLPFIEQTNAFAHLDRSLGVYHPGNAAVRRLHFPILNCPSSSKSGRGYCDYAGVHNSFETPIDVDNNGTFFLNSRMGYFEIKDGSSNTIFLGEKVTISGDLGWMSGTRATLRNTGVQINNLLSLLNRGNVPLPSGYPPGLEIPGEVTESPLPDDVYMSLVYGSGGEPFGGRDWQNRYNMPLSFEFQPPASASLAVGGFGSRHPGGAMFALGDGSVRYLSGSIDIPTYVSLGDRSDGSLLSDY